MTAPKFSVLIESRSDFHFTVPARSDRKHSWRNHFDSDSVGYQVLGRWENLAARNHGFVYEGTANTAKKSAHYRKNDAPTRRTIQLIKKFCRAKGIISDDCWGTNQWGHRVLGFWLVNHAEFCAEKDHQHRYWRPLNDAVRKARFHPWEFVANSPSIRHGFATDSQPIRHGFAADSPSIRGDFAPISPKSGFDFAPSPSSDVAPTSPQDSVKQEDAEKSLCIGMRQNGDLVAGSLLNCLNPVNLLNQKNLLNLESRENLVSPANQDSPFCSEPKNVSRSDNPISEKPAQVGQVKDEDIEVLQAQCFSLTGKTPKPNHVAQLLGHHTRQDIAEALEEYVSGLEDANDIRYAEKVFFADGGAVGIILAICQRNWELSLELMAGFFDVDLDMWLAENPAPNGISDFDYKVANAKTAHKIVVDEWNVTHPVCSQCGYQGSDSESAICKKCLKKQREEEFLKNPTCPRCGGHDLVRISDTRWNCMSPECVKRRTESIPKKPAAAATGIVSGPTN